MYNVKILKYPTGWQIRTYTKPVGFCDKNNDDGYMLQKVVVDYETEETDTRFINPHTAWVNPFTNKLETMPLSYFGDEEMRKERSIKNSVNRTVNKVYHLSRSNIWDWFITLTFDPQRVDSFNYECCTKALQNWLIVQRRTCPDLKYIIVPEKHKSGRFHFHGLFANCDGMSFVDSGKVTGDGQTIYNIGRYRLGFSTATAVNDNARVTKYISKYITKELCEVSAGKKGIGQAVILTNAKNVKCCWNILSLPHISKALKNIVNGLKLWKVEK